MATEKTIRVGLNLCLHWLTSILKARGYFRSGFFQSFIESPSSGSFWILWALLSFPHSSSYSRPCFFHHTGREPLHLLLTKKKEGSFPGAPSKRNFLPLSGLNSARCRSWNQLPHPGNGIHWFKPEMCSFHVCCIAEQSRTCL